MDEDAIREQLSSMGYRYPPDDLVKSIREQLMRGADDDFPYSDINLDTPSTPEETSEETLPPFEIVECSPDETSEESYPDTTSDVPEMKSIRSQLTASQAKKKRGIDIETEDWMEKMRELGAYAHNIDSGIKTIIKYPERQTEKKSIYPRVKKELNGGFIRPPLVTSKREKFSQYGKKH